MDKQLILNTLKKLKENSPKRNFNQSTDLIINLKGLDLKKPDHNVNLFVTLQHGTGKKITVCALVSKDLEEKSKEACDEVILDDQFQKFKDKSTVKKLAGKYDFFIAQANIMPKVATVFGRYLGPKGKMPNPKIGSVLPPNANVKQICDKLKNTVNLVTKSEPTIKCRAGNEGMSDEDIAENVLNIYNSVVQKLPNENNNVKSVMIKLTMGPSLMIEKEDKEGEQENKSNKNSSEKKSNKSSPKKQEVKTEDNNENPTDTKKDNDQKSSESKVEEKPESQ